jgi:glycerol-3-phosphate acyltransferase PlsY
VTELLYVVATYLLASVSFPQLIARAHGVDLRVAGTRNLGAGNLLREVGKTQGVLGGLLDALKPPLAILLTGAFGADRGTQLACGVVAVAAQQWPIWHRFDGGRGNSPAMALFIALSPAASLISSVPLLAGLVPGTVRRLRTGQRVLSRGTPLGILLSFALFPLAALILREGADVFLAGATTTALVVLRRLTAGVRADLAITDDVGRTIANRLLFDRSELQRRGLAAEEP